MAARKMIYLANLDQIWAHFLAKRIRIRIPTRPYVSDTTARYLTYKLSKS